MDLLPRTATVVIGQLQLAPTTKVRMDEAQAAGTQPRFTIDGSPKLENELEQLCHLCLERVREIVGEPLEAMLLGGGYGRGEGGVLQTESGDYPYNDLEFYVFLKGPLLLNQRRYQAPLHHCGEQMSRAAGVDI